MTSAKTKRGIRVRKDAEAWKTHGWTSVPNAILDSGASLGPEPVAAFCWMARHRDDFEFAADDVAGAFGVGLHKAEDWLYSLEFHGWLTRNYERDSRGRITGVEYMLHPVPVPEDKRTAKPRKERKRRSSFTKETQKTRSEPESVRTEHGATASTPEPETSRSSPTSVRPEYGRPEYGRPEYGRTEEIYKEDKTIKEDHHHERDSDDDVRRFWDDLAVTVTVDPPGRRAVHDPVAAALRTGWTPGSLASWVGARLRDAQRRSKVGNPGGFVVSQLKEIPQPQQATGSATVTVIPSWCGECEEGPRMDRSGKKCRKCHPKYASAA